MATKTKEPKTSDAAIPGNTAQGTTTDDGYKRASGSLPPMLLLEVGGKLDGRISQVDVQTTTEKNKSGKKMEKVRIFYRVVLSKDASGTDAKSKKPVTHKAGTLITLPGSGALDSTFGGIALEIEGKPNDETSEPNYQALNGILIRVDRTPDDVMKKGLYAGKTVKTYSVEWKQANQN